MFRFKKSKVSTAVLCCILAPQLVQAGSYDNAQSLGILEWTSEGVSTGSAFVDEGEHLGTEKFLYLINTSPDIDDHDAALYMLEKDASLTLKTNHPNVVHPDFKNTIIASYTGDHKSGVGVKIGDNTFAEGDKPSLIADGADIFSDDIGIIANSANISLKHTNISAVDTAIEIEDLIYEGIKPTGKGVGSKVTLEDFNIQFDGKRFNQVANEMASIEIEPAANFDGNQKTRNGVNITGTEVKGETVVNLINGQIDVDSSAVIASRAATVNLDNVEIFSTQTSGSTISAAGIDTLIDIKNSKIHTNGTAVTANTGSIVRVENSAIERRKNGYGTLARGEGALVHLINSSITLTGGNSQTTGDMGFSPAAIAVRDEGKVILDNVTIKDEVAPQKGMKGIYADWKGIVEGTQVSYESAGDRVLGVQFTDNAKVSLKDSNFNLSGENSVGVMAAGGTFTADNTIFKSKDALIRIFHSSSVSSEINLINGSKFIADDILLANDIEFSPFDDREVNLLVDGSVVGGRIVVYKGTEDMIDNKTDVHLKNKSIWSYSGKSNLRNLLLEDSLIQLTQSTGGQSNILKVDTLQGNNGVVEMWTEFQDDSSKSDIIRITNAATGQTGLRFRNAGGEGDQTLKGIKVVDSIDSSALGGPKATTTADAFYIDAGSDGYRQGKGTIAAGAFEYSLFKSEQGQEGVDESWYLRSEKSGIIDPVKPIIRPEVDSYFANRSSMLGMQQHHLKQRVINTTDGQQAWAYVAHDQGRFNNQFNFRRKTDMTTIHFGSDLYQKELAEQGLVKLGFMGLLGRADSKSKNENNDAKGKVDGYNIGGYATWYQQPESNLGAYVDTWLMQGWFKNSVKGDGLAEEKYDSQAFSTSVEAGYGFSLPWGNDANQYTIQPQVQLVFSHLDSDDVVENTATVVKHKNAWQTAYRFGVRFQGDMKQQDGSVFSPFAEWNQWRKPDESKMSFDQYQLKDKTPKNVTDLALGVKMNVQSHWDLSGQFNYQFGSQNYKQSAFQIAATYKWK